MNIRQDQSDMFDMPEDCVTEQRHVNETDTHTLLMPVNRVKQVMLIPVINSTDYSSKKHLLQVTAQVLKFISIWKHKVMKTDMSPSSLVPRRSSGHVHSPRRKERLVELACACAQL